MPPKDFEKSRTRDTTIMKRAIVIAALIPFSFALGWVSVCYRLQSAADERIAHSRNEQSVLTATLRQRIYGSNYFHQKGISEEDDRRLKRFNPADSKGVVTMSYIGGLGGSDTCIRIQSDGNVLAIVHGATRKVGTLDPKRCADFFTRVLTSGILNYSDDVIALKLDLTPLNRGGGVLDAPNTEFIITVPELEIEKKISICSPQSYLRHHPDMIEFQLVAALEKEILGFVPTDDPIWSLPGK